VCDEEQQLVAAQEDAIDGEEIAGNHARLWGAKTRSACKFDVSGARVTVLVSPAPAIT
jgi:hypothetical protein